MDTKAKKNSVSVFHWKNILCSLDFYTYKMRVIFFLLTLQGNSEELLVGKKAPWIKDGEFLPSVISAYSSCSSK